MSPKRKEFGRSDISYSGYWTSGWKVSGKNVTFFCGTIGFDKIVWPKFKAENATESEL